MAGLLEQIDAARNGGAAPNLLSQIDAARGAPQPAGPTRMTVPIPDDILNAPSAGDVLNGLNAATDFARKGATFGLSDEVGAAGGAVGTAIGRAIMGDKVVPSLDSGRGLSSLVTGQADPTLGSFYDQSLGAIRGEQAQQATEFPLVTTIAEIIGSLGGVRGAPGAAPAATLGGRAGQGAAVGGGMGAAAGFGNSEGVENRVEGAATGGGLGALLGGAIPLVESGIGALARAIFTRDPTQAADTLGAFERQGVRPTAATVGGRAAGSQLENYGEMLPLPANPVTRARDQQFNQMSGRADELARRGGGTPAADVDEFGNVVRREALQGGQNIRDDISGMETQFAQQFGERTGVPVDETRNAINMMIQRADPQTADMLTGALADLDRAVVPGSNEVPFVVSDNLRKRIGRTSSGQTIDNQFMRPIYGGMSADMEAAANARGLGQQWTAMKTREAQVYNSDQSPALGGDLDLLAGAEGAKGGGDVYREFIGSEFQNGDRIGALMRNVSPQGRADIQASTIAQLGRATAGRQNAAGDQFSPESFLTNWNRMSDNARQQIFGSDPQLVADLNDMARIAEGMRAAGNTRNFSNTQRIATTAAGLGSLGTAVAAGAIPAAGAAAGVGATYAGLGGLVSQRLARWAAGQGPEFATRFAHSLPGLFTLPSQGEDEGDPTINAIMKARGNGDNR